MCYHGILRNNVQFSAYCGIICTISHFPVQFPLAATRSISFRDSTDLISHFPVQFPLTATRSSHFPFAVRLDRSHFATRPISFPISVQFPLAATRFDHQSHFPIHDDSKSGESRTNYFRMSCRSARHARRFRNFRHNTGIMCPKSLA